LKVFLKLVLGWNACIGGVVLGEDFFTDFICNTLIFWLRNAASFYLFTSIIAHTHFLYEYVSL
jgi:hypothetical protein